MTYIREIYDRLMLINSLLFDSRDRTIGDVLRLSHGQQNFEEEGEQEGGNEEGEGIEELRGCKAQ